MIRDILEGITKYFEALAFMRRHRLMRYFWYSGLLGLAILLGVGAVIIWSHDALSAWILSLIPWQSGFLSTISDVLTISSLTLTFFLVFKYLILILTAPMMSALSERSEAILLGLKGEELKYTGNVLREIIRGIRLNVRNIVREIGLTILLLILSFIPAFAVVTAPLIFLVQAYYAGFGNYDFWAERHFTFSGTIRFVRDHRAMVTGNGIVFVVLLAIPILGVFIAPPLATVAATIHGSEKWAAYKAQSESM